MLFAEYMAIGIITGILSGLLGLGGGVVIVPALVLLGNSIHTAAGTSLAVVMFTTASAAWSQHKRGAVAWNYLRVLIPGMVIGTIAGVFLGRTLSSQTLRYVFAIFCLALAIKMFFASDRPTKEASPVFSRTTLFLVALLAGVLAGLLGVGGGVIVIPILMGLGLSMSKVSGTSAACIFPTAVVGTLFSAIAGLHIPDLPPYSTGYIYWPAALIIGGVSMLLAPVGVTLAHRLPEKSVKQIFGGILLLIAWQMAR